MIDSLVMAPPMSRSWFRMISGKSGDFATAMRPGAALPPYFPTFPFQKLAEQVYRQQRNTTVDERSPAMSCRASK